MIWYIAGALVVLAILAFIYSLCNIAGLGDRAEERRMTVPPKNK